MKKTKPKNTTFFTFIFILICFPLARCNEFEQELRTSAGEHKHKRQTSERSAPPSAAAAAACSKKREQISYAQALQQRKLGECHRQDDQWQRKQSVHVN